MTVDGNDERRSLREYRLIFRDTLEEKGDFDERPFGYKYKSRERYVPGDIVYVKARSSRNPNNSMETFKTGQGEETLREAVVLMGRLWKPGKYSDRDPHSGRKIEGLRKSGGYFFKNRTGLNNQELRDNYWSIITSYDHLWYKIENKLMRYGKIKYTQN